MRRSRSTLLVLLGASVLEALAWWVPLPVVGAVRPYIPLRLALAVAGGAWRATGLIPPPH